MPTWRMGKSGVPSLNFIVGYLPPPIAKCQVIIQNIKIIVSYFDSYAQYTVQNIEIQLTLFRSQFFDEPRVLS